MKLPKTLVKTKHVNISIDKTSKKEKVIAIIAIAIIISGAVIYKIF